MKLRKDQLAIGSMVAATAWFLSWNIAGYVHHNQLTHGNEVQVQTLDLNSMVSSLQKHGTLLLMSTQTHAQVSNVEHWGIFDLQVDTTATARTEYTLALAHINRSWVEQTSDSLIINIPNGEIKAFVVNPILFTSTDNGSQGFHFTNDRTLIEQKNHEQLLKKLEQDAWQTRNQVAVDEASLQVQGIVQAILKAIGSPLHVVVNVK